MAEIWTNVLSLSEATKKERPVAVIGLILSASIFPFFSPSVNTTAYLEIPPFLRIPQNPFFNDVKRILNEKRVIGSGSWEH